MGLRWRLESAGRTLDLAISQEQGLMDEDAGHLISHGGRTHDSLFAGGNLVFIVSAVDHGEVTYALSDPPRTHTYL